MATVTRVLLIDDLDGGEAVETVKFNLDRQDYEIDLSEANAGRLRDKLARFVGIDPEPNAPEEAPFLAAGDQTVTLALKKAHKRPRGPADIIKPHDDPTVDTKGLEQLQKMMQQLGNDANNALSTP